MKRMHYLILGLFAAFLAAPLAWTADVEPQRILFTSCKVFDGVSDALDDDRNVLVEGNLIVSTNATPGVAQDAEIIDCDGRTLMPGLIDAHTHLFMNMPGGVAGQEAGTWDQIGARAAAQATEYLYNGFTTVREMGGGGSGLKKTVDEGLIEGPRIYPSGGFISQTSGHGDLRSASMRNPNLPPYANDSNAQRLGVTIVADGEDAVLTAVRQNLSQGATQIKLMAGGGVASILDPLHTQQFLPEEIETAVRAAADWDTYVAVHVFSDEGIRRSVEAGVKSIEHGFFASRKTMKLMKDKDVFLVAQMTGISPYLAQNPGLQNKANQAKLALATDLSKDFVENVKAIRPKMAFQSDIVFATGEQLRAQMDYEKWFHANLFGNHAMLVAATSAAGELMSYSGKANPYLEGPLGVIREGAYADILVVDGNPLEDISVIGGNEKWYDAEPRARDIPTIRIIMKDGVIYKNTL